MGTDQTVLARVIRLSSLDCPKDEFSTDPNDINDQLEYFHHISKTVLEELTETTEKMRQEHELGLKVGIDSLLAIIGRVDQPKLTLLELKSQMEEEQFEGIFAQDDLLCKVKAYLHHHSDNSETTKTLNNPYLKLNPKEFLTYLRTEILRIKSEEESKANTIIAIYRGACDQQIIRKTEDLIKLGHSAPFSYYTAVQETCSHYVGTINPASPMYSKMASMFRDIDKMRDKIVRALLLEDQHIDNEPVIIVGENLQLPDLLPYYQDSRDSKNKLLGMIAYDLDPTDHAVIVFRSEMPIISLDAHSDKLKNITTGQRILMDGKSGEIIVNPNDEQINSRFQNTQNNLAARTFINDQPMVFSFSSGENIGSVLANVNLTTSIRPSTCLSGIGLFRSEIALAKYGGPHASYERQFSIYKQLFDTARNVEHIRGNRFKLTIRVADYSSPDKHGLIHSESSLNQEVMPGFDRATLVRHLTSIIEASKKYNSDTIYPFTILFPAVSSKFQMRRYVGYLDESISTEIKDKRLIKIGAQIESLEGIDNLSKILKASHLNIRDITVGTNDLLCSIQNVKRGKGKTDPYDPRLYKALKKIYNTVETANRKRQGKDKITLKLCGDIASDPDIVPVLRGLGYKNFSIRIDNAEEVKAEFARLSLKDCLDMAKRILATDVIIDVALKQDREVNRNWFRNLTRNASSRSSYKPN